MPGLPRTPGPRSPPGRSEGAGAPQMLAALGMCWREGGGMETSAAGCVGFCGTRLGILITQRARASGGRGSREPPLRSLGASSRGMQGGWEGAGGAALAGPRPAWAAGRRTSPRRRARGEGSERVRGGGPLPLATRAVPRLRPPQAAAPSRQAVQPGGQDQKPPLPVAVGLGAGDPSSASSESLS